MKDIKTLFAVVANNIAMVTANKVITHCAFNFIFFIIFPRANPTCSAQRALL